MARLAAVLAIALSVACRPATEPTTLVNGLPPDVAAAVVGTYQLQSYKALSLPALFAGPGMTCSINGCFPNGVNYFIDGGALTINANGTYTRVTSYRYTRSGQADQSSDVTFQGSWSGNSVSGPVTLTFVFGGTTLNWSGTITGNTLSLSVQGEPWVYLR